MICVLIGNQIQKRSIGTYGFPKLVGNCQGKHCGRCNSGLPRATQGHSRDVARVVEEVRSGRSIQANGQRIRERIQHRRREVCELYSYLFPSYFVTHITEEGEENIISHIILFQCNFNII